MTESALVTYIDLVASTDGNGVMEDLKLLAEADIPTSQDDTTEFWKFQCYRDDSDETALVMFCSRVPDQIPLIRIHSGCITGDIFGSLKCDCGPQLRKAQELISKRGYGAIIYFPHHEGRGIGIVNKIKAYALQQQGIDTVEANLELGFEADSRDFSLAAKFVDYQNWPEVELLTNNPQKVEHLGQRINIKIYRSALEIPTNIHNREYMETKRTRMGHMISS